MRNVDGLLWNASLYSLRIGRHAQAAVASPDEGGTMVVHSATQSLDTVQRAVAKTLGVAENKVLDCAWRATSVPFMWHCSQTTGQGQ